MLKRVFVSSFANQAAIRMTRCMVGAVYLPLTHYNPSPGVNYAYANCNGTYPTLWPDDNHSQIERLYLPIIQGAGAGDPGLIPNDVDLLGAELRISLCTNNLHLPKAARLKAHFQNYDPEAYDGFGTGVNYLSKMNLETALGYDDPYYRSASGQTRTAGWTDITVPFTPDDWYPIDGNAAKVAAKVYGRSGDADDTIEQSVEKALIRDPREKVWNMMIVMACGTSVPSPVPMQGELYIRKYELWADADRNTGLAEV